MKISLVFLFAFFGGFLTFWMRGIAGVLSYEAGFVSFICVFLSLYFSIKCKIPNLLPKENGDKTEEKISFTQKMSMGIGLSFSFLRIIAYVVLVGILIMLIRYGVFDIYVYMIGIFLGLCGTFLLIF